MKELKGLAGAPGCASGRAVVLKGKKLGIERAEVANPEAEANRLQEARGRYSKNLCTLEKQAEAETGAEAAGIFAAYREILADDVFFDKVFAHIGGEKVNAEFAIELERAEIEKLFAMMDDPYLKERMSDVNNVCSELICEMNGGSGEIQLDAALGDALIIVAEDLTPADTIRLDKSRLKGFVTEKGGVTSHTVILAKTLGIPAVVGAPGVTAETENGMEVILDGDLGILTIEPEAAQLAEAVTRQAEEQAQKKLFAEGLGRPAVTRDGITIRVNVNSGDADSIAAFDSRSCDGIGLFRTEFLYMGKTAYPTEEEQFEVYRTMAEKNEGRELIIRTLDIGGDKQVGYMDLPREDNPFLGYRAIRLCLDRPAVFRTQLRAILRAGMYGNVKIMFPMIVNLEELDKAKAVLEEAKASLRLDGIVYKENIQVGIMIETPAAVLISDKLAAEVDFFSIGSNDLIQYTTATDRMNESIQWLYDSFNISVLRSIRLVCENAKKYGTEVGICGEVASESLLVPLWVAMGVDELSVVPAQVGRVKYLIGRHSAAELQQTLERVLDCSRISQVKEILSRL